VLGCARIKTKKSLFAFPPRRIHQTFHSCRKTRSIGNKNT